MPDHHVASAKIVATPTDTAWSQAYHAGSLFAVLSLTQDEKAKETSLPAAGREFFNVLESEFFALEEKSLTSIKQGLLQSIRELPEGLLASVAVAYIKEATLYVFLMGTGAVMLKRDASSGALLEKHDADPKDREIHAASGRLEDNDTVALLTEQCRQSIPKEALTEALEQPAPQDAAELLAPLIHDKEIGGASGLFLSYTAPNADEEEEKEEDSAEPPTAEAATKDDEEEKPEEVTDEKEAPVRSRLRTERTSETEEYEETAVTVRQESFLTNVLNRIPRVALGVSHKRKVFLSVAAIILVVLAASIYMTMQKKEAAKVEAAFREVYPQAQKYYDEGQGLKSLNTPLAQDDFRKAKKLLEDNQNSFKPGSKEREQLDALLADINKEITADATESVPAKEASADASPALTAAKEQKGALGVTNDERGVYTLTKDAVVRGVGNAQEVIENDADWASAVGISAYSGNLYILDRAEGILKFVAGADGFGKQSYFTGDAPDMGKAVDLAIDSSVYVLSQDGAIRKYTRGTADTFKLSGLTKPLSSPKRIFTNSDTDNVYILDNGNSRIVKLTKEGAFIGQYAADFLKNATFLDVSESSKKAYVLSGSKVYEIAL